MFLAKKSIWTKTAYLLGVLLLVSALALTFAGRASAVETITDDTVAIVEEGTLIDDDLMIAGTRVEMNGTVTGDVFAFGTDVEVNGIVEGNLFASGQTIVVNGVVEGSVFGSGFAITVGPNAAIARNLYFGGFSLTAQPGSVVDRSLFLGGYQASLNGEIGRNITAGLGAFELDGPVGGDVFVDLGDTSQADEAPPTGFFPFMPGNITFASPGVSLGSGAQVAGDVTYRVSSFDFEAPDQPNAQVQYDVPEPPEEASSNLLFRILDAIRRRVAEFISLIIVGALLLWLQTDNFQRVSSQMRERLLASAGYGLLVGILFPIAMLVAGILLIAVVLLLSLVTLGGLTGTSIQLGGTGFAAVWIIAGVLASLVTKAAFGYLVGRAILENAAPTFFEGRWGNFGALVLGVFLYELVRAIPVIGALVGLIVIVLGLGAIFLILQEWWQGRSAEAAAAA